MSNYILEHYGVKGQRWGVRKDVIKGSSREASVISGKPLSNMSTQEINTVVNRFEAEKRYNRMMAEVNAKNEGRASRAIKWASKVVSEAVVDAAKNELRNYAQSEFKKVISSRTGVTQTSGSS